MCSPNRTLKGPYLQGNSHAAEGARKLKKTIRTFELQLLAYRCPQPLDRLGSRQIVGPSFFAA